MAMINPLRITRDVTTIRPAFISSFKYVTSGSAYDYSFTHQQ